MEKNFVVALLSLLVSFILGALALLFTVATPELRQCFGLEENKTIPSSSAVKSSTSVNSLPSKKTEDSSGPFLCTLEENKPQRVGNANVTLSFVFNVIGGQIIVSLTVTPDRKESSVYAVWTGGSAQFSSPSGSFLVNVLSMNYDEKTVTVQVSKMQ